ncbi:conserved hypothetical protein [Verticillium alfalfae VaMs.102]|uniref:Small-subunit processome Utp12 domain-containing protein n=1 Tax=Verticillium alfalfae (strain VaMs.102 / ATCC MYA-4576 / FGSC 10136) TaxID=526221 RepID=C9SCJ7_VERA1|nr:conserved hypothetical protein [Verticillium alfalfae VaMs.102]EEY16812.1 conserved hypothetical protein [Verticillium alfalfae VaMs.102]
MTWVKWTLVAHGGALALQPKVLDRLVALQKVLNERARGLPSLLALKGKLDMLDAQMQLRQSRQRGGGRGVDEEEEEGDDDEDEEGAIYVEGEEADVDVAIAEANGALLALEEGDDDDVEEGESDDDGEEVLDEDDVDHLDVEDSMDEDEDSGGRGRAALEAEEDGSLVWQETLSLCTREPHWITLHWATHPSVWHERRRRSIGSVSG